LRESGANGGFGYANNIALRALAGRAPAVPGRQAPAEIPPQGDAGFHFGAPYILFLNPDTVLPADALDVLVSFLEQTPAAGAVGPRMQKPDGSLDLACRRAFPTPLNALFKLTGLSRLFPRHPLIARYNLTHLRDDQLAAVDSVMGAFMLVRGTALGQTGLFDERFFMYGEDLDLAYRLKARGWQVYYNPEVTVLHIKGASSRKRSSAAIREFYRAMHVFYTKHYAARYGRGISTLVRLGIGLREAVALAANATRPAAQKRVS
jgi:GT2 family glycosyltransferase